MTIGPSTFPTERLILRRATLGDAEAIFEEYARDPEVTRYLTWRPYTESADTARFLQRCAAGWASGEEFSWVITLATSDRPVGMLACRVRGHAADIGYVLTRRLWGQGLMTEAARAVVGWASADPSLFRVWAVCDTENLASAHVLEKVGMEREGVLRRYIVHPNVSPEPRDCFVYAKVRVRV